MVRILSDMKSEQHNIAFYFLVSLILMLPSRILADSHEFIYYKVSGGYSAYEFAEVTVYQDGKACVNYNKLSIDGDAEFLLSSDELSSYKAMISFVDFFGEVAEDPGIITCVGHSILRISLGNEERTLEFRSRSQLSLLINHIWRLIEQGVAINELRDKNDIYQVLIMVAPNAAYPKVIQPWIFEDDLKNFIQHSSDRDKLGQALEALANIIAADNWFGFIWDVYSRADSAKREQLSSILGSHLSYSNIPDSHLDALRPLFIWFLEQPEVYRIGLEAYELNKYFTFCSILGNSKYEYAIPVLERIIDESPHNSLKTRAGWSLDSLAIYRDQYRHIR